MMRLFALLLAALALPVLAQDADIQKLLIQRQQQSDAFSLQLRQSQEVLKVPPAMRPAVAARQHSERVHLENLSDKQLRDVRPETPETLRAHERHQAEVERRPFYSPIVEIPFKAAPPPPPLQPSLKNDIEAIELPRPDSAR